MHSEKLKVMILEKIKEILLASATGTVCTSEILLLKSNLESDLKILKVDLHGQLRFVTHQQSKFELNRSWICPPEADLASYAHSIMNLKSESELQADLVRLSA